jgi:Flp pilus assembly protein TadB
VVGGILAAAACWWLPRLLGRDTEHARRVARIEAVATWTEMIRDTLSAAAGLEQAILATAPLAPAPVRAEVTVLAARLDRRERLVPALRSLAHDLADPTADLVVAALVIATEQHARQLADLLGALAANARERASMRMRVDAGRARTRTSVRVIVATTLAFALLLVLINPAYMAAYNSVDGQLVLLAVGALFACGFAWLARIGAVAEPGRILSAPQRAPAHSGTIDGRPTAVAPADAGAGGRA